MDPRTIDHIRRLARLDGGDAADLQRIVAYVDRLREVDVAGVAPYESAPDPVTRPDRVQEGLTSNEALANAPDREQDWFRVRRVLEKGR